MPFLVNEDRALKSKFSGLTVRDATSPVIPGREVLVRYKNPEYELATAEFPLILISHQRISKADEREMRGTVQLNYAPEGYKPWADMTDPNASPYFTEAPIPVNIDYQVDVHCRKWMHLLDLTGQLATFRRLPYRFGFLEIPEDRTVRRLDLMGGPEYSENKDESGKRLFTGSYVLRVSAEIFWADIYTLTEVQKVLIDFELLPDHTPIT